MGRSCGKNGRQERYIQGFCGVLVGRYERKRTRGRVILKWIFRSVTGSGTGQICFKTGKDSGLMLAL